MGCIFLLLLFIVGIQCRISTHYERYHQRQHDFVWPPIDASSCSQGTKQKAMYGRMIFDPPLSQKPMTSLAVDVQWDDLQFHPIENPNKKGGVYVAYTMGMKNGPGGYFGVQIRSTGGMSRYYSNFKSGLA